jgi:hypothetical protein
MAGFGGQKKCKQPVSCNPDFSHLLCAVANLLNGGGPLSTLLTQLQTLLNQILAAL